MVGQGLLLGVLLALGVGIWTPGAVAQTPSSLPVAPGGPDLQTMLEKGLRARRPVEFAFIASVVQMVDAGTLPQSIVQTSFLWVQKTSVPVSVLPAIASCASTTNGGRSVRAAPPCQAAADPKVQGCVRPVWLSGRD